MKDGDSDKYGTDRFLQVNHHPMMKRFSSRAMEIMGLYGQLAPDSKHSALEGGVRHTYLESVGINIAGGTSEIQRNIIATRGLGMPRGA